MLKTTRSFKLTKLRKLPALKEEQDKTAVASEPVASESTIVSSGSTPKKPNKTVRRADKWFSDAEAEAGAESRDPYMIHPRSSFCNIWNLLMGFFMASLAVTVFLKEEFYQKNCIARKENETLHTF